MPAPPSCISAAMGQVCDTLVCELRLEVSGRGNDEEGEIVPGGGGIFRLPFWVAPSSHYISQLKNYQAGHLSHNFERQ